MDILDDLSGYNLDVWADIPDWTNMGQLHKGQVEVEWKRQHLGWIPLDARMSPKMLLMGGGHVMITGYRHVSIINDMRSRCTGAWVCTCCPALHTIWQKKGEYSFGWQGSCLGCAKRRLGVFWSLVVLSWCLFAESVL